MDTGTWAPSFEDSSPHSLEPLSLEPTVVHEWNKHLPFYKRWHCCLLSDDVLLCQELAFAVQESCRNKWAGGKDVFSLCAHTGSRNLFSRIIARSSHFHMFFLLKQREKLITLLPTLLSLVSHRGVSASPSKSSTEDLPSLCPLG